MPRTILRLSRQFLVLLSLLLCLACNDETEVEAGDSDAATSDEMGSAQADAALPLDMDLTPVIVGVGFQESTLTYRSLGTDRTLPLSFWYPSTANTGASVRYNGFLSTDNAFKDVPLSDVTDMPVMLFSHGSRSMGAASVPFMAEHFAKAGWLVVSWEHVGDTTPDGTGADLTFIHRPLDTIAVLDFLYDPSATHPFADRISETVLMSGWSRGGYTALANGGASYDLAFNDENCAGDDPIDFCFAYRNYRDQFEQGFKDDRIKGLILLASGDYNRFGGGVSNVLLPTIMWTATVDLNNPNEVDGDPIWAALSGDNKFRFNIDGAGHWTFTSLCPISGPLGINNGCDEDAFDIPTAHNLLNEYNLLFANAMLRDDERALTTLLALTAESIGNEQVTFEKKVAE